MPKTLEEAIAAITQLQTQVTSITKERDDERTLRETAEAKAKTILDEKKDLLKLFDDKDKEGMTDTEKKLAEALEESETKRVAFEKQIKDEADARNAAENDRITKSVEERITKAAKGDTKVAEQLRANIALLEKMPRTSDGEIDAVVTAAWNMRGTTEANPLTQTNNTTGGNPPLDSKPNFADTDAGKALGGKLGLTEVVKSGDGK